MVSPALFLWEHYDGRSGVCAMQVANGASTVVFAPSEVVPLAGFRSCV
jgi:hypothetical protein